MIVLTNSSAQTLAAGASMTFDTTIINTKNGECHRENTGSVKMCSNGIYTISFNGNIGGTSDSSTAQLSLETGGEILSGTTMISATATAGNLNNVSACTAVSNCCCDYDRITVVNTGSTEITVGAGATLFVRRLC